MNDQNLFQPKPVAQFQQLYVERPRVIGKKGKMVKLKPLPKHDTR